MTTGFSFYHKKVAMTLSSPPCSVQEADGFASSAFERSYITG